MGDVTADDDVNLAMGRNQAYTSVAMYNHWTGKGSLLYLDAPGILRLMQGLRQLEAEVRSCPVYEELQLVEVITVPARAGSDKRGLLALFYKKVKDHATGRARPVVVLYMKRGDQNWCMQARFSGRRLADLQRLVQLVVD